MGWRKANFRGKEVWAEVGLDGTPKGRLANVRYQFAAGAKVYSTTAADLAFDAESPVEELPDGGGKRRAASGFGSAGSRTAEQAAAAKEHAEGQLAAFDGAVAFTDGACTGNPGPAGAGARLELPDGRIAERSLSLGRATNNVGELTAVKLALELLEEVGWPTDSAVRLFTDSDYAAGVLVRGWKAKANKELIDEVRAMLKLRPGVRVEWMAGHVGVAGNERADELARMGVRGVSAKRWLDPKDSA